MTGSQFAHTEHGRDSARPVRTAEATEPHDTDDQRNVQYSPITNHRSAPRIKPWVIGAAFASAFIFGFIFIALALSLITGAGSDSIPTEPVEIADTDVRFPDAFVVNSPGLALKVADSPALSPVRQTDFVFFAWFKLRRTPSVDDRLTFVGKYDPSTKVRAGYSFGLGGSPDGVRPLVYWQDEMGQGRWVTFASAKVQPKEWTLMVVSFREGRFLGAHLASIDPSFPVEALGGYDFEGVIPSNESELEVGAFGSSKFRGRIGPFGVLHTKDLSSKLPALIDSLRANPTSIPEEISDSVALWASPLTDLGPNKIQITPPGGRGARQRNAR